jgi:4-hydroxy-tetrahydrodipicolinate synthase
MFQGIYVATATPFRPDGSLDEAAYAAHVHRLVAAGVHGLVPSGTTGEGPTLNAGERQAMIRLCREAAQGRTKVVAGAGTYNTAASVEAARAAKDAGADGVLAVVPYYNKPMQHGMILHFQAIADAGLPVMIYNIPGRTSINMTAESIAEAAKHPQIAAVKEATGTVTATAEIVALAPRLDVLAGDDALFLPCLAVGGVGVVSVAANVDPARMVALWNAWQAGDLAGAQKLNRQLWPLFRALFVETNPIPVKAALRLLGHFGPTLRLPMTEAMETTVARLSVVLRELGLLGGAK